MKSFEYHNPTRIIFGENILSSLGKETAKLGSRGLLIYGKNSIHSSGVYDRVCQSLKSAGVTIIIEHPGVKANPTLEHTREGIQKVRHHKLDVVVAVGGGSVIDEAKAIAAGSLYEQDVWDFYCGKAVPQAALPVVTVCTLPATASEMNCGTVITNESTQQKFGVLSPLLYPKVSFLDPSLTFTLPREQIVYGTVDALSHLMEGYFTQKGGWTPIQDRFAEGLMKSLMEALDRILKNPTDLDARATQMWGCTWAWNGFSATGIGSFGLPNHALGHALGGIYDLAHGATLSIVIPGWCRYEAKSRCERLALFAKNVFDLKNSSEQSVAMAGVAKLEAWYLAVGAPTRMSEAGINSPDISLLTQKAYELATLWGMPELTKDIISEIYNDVK